MKMKVLVTGARGQLAQTIVDLYSKKETEIEFTFVGRKDLDITDFNEVATFFKEKAFNYCINAAAYTHVDKAEDDEETANNVNALAVKNLALACNKHDIILIHISTDFVFDGNSTIPYKETDTTNPIGVYGETKRKGEEFISRTLDKYYIIRTSWLYSNFGKNFVKTMLKLATDKNEISVVNDQKGTPTNANDLAQVIIKIIKSNKKAYGLYHYSNLGEATWYGFAKEIFELTNTKAKLIPTTSNAFITKAKRPKYSVLDKTKISATFDLKILNWKESLEKSLESI